MPGAGLGRIIGGTRGAFASTGKSWTQLPEAYLRQASSDITLLHQLSSFRLALSPTVTVIICANFDLNSL